ncbi:MAG: MFS transporter [Sedimenticola sp.]|nr:MFS transporter [Sedimenticola sp.]
MSAAVYPPLRLAWMIWGLGAALYLIGFYQRVAPGVITSELMTDFQLNAAGLGNLSAFYFYSYVAMQVPTGLLADHWGPRRLLSLGATVAGLGTLLFAMAPDTLWANFGRLMIGGSVAVAFVGMLKLAGHWLPPKQYSLASGMALFCGVVGAVFAGVPLRLLVDAFGWRPVMVSSALVTFIVALGIWLLVRDDPTEKGYASHVVDHGGDGSTTKPIGALAGIRAVLGYRNSWLLFFVPGAGVGSVLTFAGLWGVPFLTTHYGLEKTTAAAICSALLVSWAIGGPVFGWLSDHLGHRKPLYLIGCVVQLVSWSIVILVPGLPIGVLILLLVIAGFFSGNMIIGFAFARESAPGRLAGTASGLVNMGVMIGPMLLQPAVGWLLDHYWRGEMVEGARLYAWEAYEKGFTLMLAWLALALVLMFFTRETHCKPMA